MSKFYSCAKTEVPFYSDKIYWSFSISSVFYIVFSILKAKGKIKIPLCFQNAIYSCVVSVKMGFAKSRFAPFSELFARTSFSLSPEIKSFILPERINFLDHKQ